MCATHIAKVELYSYSSMRPAGLFSSPAIDLNSLAVAFPLVHRRIKVLLDRNVFNSGAVLSNHSYSLVCLRSGPVDQNSSASRDEQSRKRHYRRSQPAPFLWLDR